MLIFKIADSDVRAFMDKLLRGQTFYAFEVRDIEIFALTQVTLSGKLDNSFLEVPTESAFCTWALLQPYVFTLIKGTRRPKSIKLTLTMPKEQMETLHQNAALCALNIRFMDGEILITTATSQKTFVPDKSVEHIWDDYATHFFQENGICATIIQ
jgi:hypothetical protein